MIVAIYLLIHNIPKIILFAWEIFDFAMFVQYLLYKNQILQYMKYVLYRLKKTKIVFGYYLSSDAKSYKSIFYK